MRAERTFAIEKRYNLIVLLTGTLLASHEFACIWIFLGLLREDSWINVLKAKNYEGQWEKYGVFEIYVVALYWTSYVLTTVGYGDFSGITAEEMFYSMFL